jgi:isopenicillin-N epimerase
MADPNFSFKNDFILDSNIVFLNHGSFGATPRQVFETYQAWQRRLEQQPVEFLGRKASEFLAQARARLAEYLGTASDNLVYVPNVTVALNIVARSIRFSPRDEVLATTMEYGAIDRTWRFLAQQQGFKYINQPISTPVSSCQEIVDEIWAGVTEHTKIIFVSHITSPTAIIFPVKEICCRARQQGILTVIDGAHAPGQIDVNLSDLGADFYGGNCHKWLCAPKGSGFLFAAPSAQSLIEPLIVSWGWQSEHPGPSQFIDYLEWTGTRDLSAFLSVPSAIQYQQDHQWHQVRAACHALARQALAELTQRARQQSLYSATDDWFAQMVVARLPDAIDPLQLHDTLWNDFHIEVPVLNWNGMNLIRISFQAYNTEDDLQILLAALDKLIY